MNWDAIGAMGEVVGGLAVIATLIYVARQIHQTTAAVLATNHEGMLSALRATRHAVAFDAEFADLITRGEARWESLTELEARRFDEFVQSQFEIWEQAYLNHQNGTIDDTAWTGWDGLGRQKMVTSGHRAVWQRARLEFYEPFRTYIDREIFAG